MSLTFTESPPARRSRGGLFVVRCVLWGVVAVAALVAFRKSPNAVETLPTAVSPSSNEGSLPPLAVSEDGSLSPIKRTPKTLVPQDGVPADALPKWDPKGIADFSFTERSGRTVTKADLLGHPWVVCFVFTKCAGPCMTVSGSMTRLQEALKDTDVRLVTLTVDPDRDSPKILADYADGFGADADRWLFLTGDKEKLYNLTMKSFLMPVYEAQGVNRKPGWEVVHTTNILLVDETGVVQAKYDGRDLDQVQALIDRLTGPAIAELPETRE